MVLEIPRGLAASCRKSLDRRAWLDRLPGVLRKLQQEWSLRLGAPFDSEEVSCSYVAAAVRADGTPAVLKIAMPHMESHHEIHGLRFWCGDPTVRLLMANDELGAMLRTKSFQVCCAVSGVSRPNLTRFARSLR